MSGPFMEFAADPRSFERWVGKVERRLEALEGRAEDRTGHEGPLAALTRLCASMFATTGWGPIEIVLPRTSFGALCREAGASAETDDGLRSVRLAMPHGMLTVRREGS